MTDSAGGIQVNLGDLRQFAAYVEAETHSNLDRSTEDVWSTGRGDFPFGQAVPGSAVRQVRERYGTCYARTAEALDGYVRASRILVHAIREVATYYSGADALAEDKVSHVRAALTYAIAEAGRVEWEAQARAAVVETARETERTNR